MNRNPIALARLQIFAGLLICMLSCSVDGQAAEPLTIPLWTDAELGMTAEDDTEIRRERGQGNAWVGEIRRPTLTVYPSEGGAHCGAGIVICPGGGYGGLAIDKEGHDVARWFASKGITAGVLKYRCGGGENQHPVPRDDARQAVKIFRSHARDWEVDPDRVGIMGFSAGGHLASTLATDPETAINFAALIYPVVTMTDPVTHSGSKKNLLGESPSQALVLEMSREQQVSSSTCPVFLVHAGDDRGVPVENSLRFYEACIRHGVPAEMHLFPSGGHGFGMFRGDRPVDQWPLQMLAWMKTHGWCGTH